jgi:hypothetical protein
MEYGSVPDALVTPTDFEQIARELGADAVSVHEDHETREMSVEVSGMTTVQRETLSNVIRERRHPGVRVSVMADTDVMRRTTYDGHEIVVHTDGQLYVDDHDITEQYRGEPISESVIYDTKHRIAAGELPDKPEHEMLTDQELWTVLSVLPDDWEPGDDIEFTDVDWDRLQPIADDYGGFPQLIEAVKRSTTQGGTDASRDTVTVESPSSTFHDDESSQSAADRQTDDAVVAAQNAYVEGEIDILELEDRLEDAIDLDHNL